MNIDDLNLSDSDKERLQLFALRLYVYSVIGKAIKIAFNTLTDGIQNEFIDNNKTQL